MKKEKIPVDNLFPSFVWSEAKIHVAQKAGNTRPIDVFTRSFNEWQNNWNGAFQSNHCWNRKYIFSMIELPNQPNRWLFGGIFRVISYKYKKNRKGKICMYYKVDIETRWEAVIGRLVIHWVKDARAKGRKPETMLSNMSVAEILPELYVGEDFPGYSNIDHNYGTLEKLWKELKPDWMVALKHCQGIYLITDTKTGLRYIGSAYGTDGIWSRWSSYFRTGGHGNNKLLKTLLKNKTNGKDYARKYFKFSLLEQASSRDSEQYIIMREEYWKRVLMTTHGKFGLNDN